MCSSMVEHSPGLRDILGSNPGTADQCFSAIMWSIFSFLFTLFFPTDDIATICIDHIALNVVICFVNYF